MRAGAETVCTRGSCSLEGGSSWSDRHGETFLNRASFLRVQVSVVYGAITGRLGKSGALPGVDGFPRWHLAEAPK